MINRPAISPALLTQAGELIVPLNDPFTRRRINIPARSVKCRHLACWDLQTYLEMNSEINYFSCPLCRETAYSDEIEVDSYMWNILKKLPQPRPGEVEVDEVLIGENADWKPSRSALRLSQPIPISNNCVEKGSSVRPLGERNSKISSFVEMLFAFLKDLYSTHRSFL